MAARLSLDERVFVESSLGAGRSVADAARRLGRDRSTVHRELARCGGRAMTPARRTRGHVRGRGAFGPASWRTMRCWLPRSMSA